MKKIRITVWNENIQDREEGERGDELRACYPDGIHNAIAKNIACDDFEVRTATLDMPEHGLTDEVLESTDVLFWWGHRGHHLVEDRIVDKVQERVLQGMGIVVLHSGHYAKIFKRLLGTSCSLRVRGGGEKERLWVVNPAHPIARDLPPTFSIPHTEMFGEPFGIPQEAEDIFISWYSGGNVFRSGITLERGAGKLFYLAPGHETYPIYHDPNIIKILQNAARWAAPQLPPQKTSCWHGEPPLENTP